MSLGNIGADAAPMSWIHRGWAALSDYAHNAITHFSHDQHEQPDDEKTPARWGIVAVDLVDHDNTLEARFELPGMAKEDLDVEVHGGQLVVSGEKHMSSSREDGGCLVTERAFGRFRRAIALPAEVSLDDSRADYKDGVLTIRLPKAAAASERSVRIN